VTLSKDFAKTPLLQWLGKGIHIFSQMGDTLVYWLPFPWTGEERWHLPCSSFLQQIVFECLWCGTCSFVCCAFTSVLLMVAPNVVSLTQVLKSWPRDGPISSPIP
jgi:hypothetical protein